MTLGDLAMFGDAEDREAVASIGAEIQAEYDAADHDLLKLIRSGGHTVEANADHTKVWIHSYRNGRTYGLWNLECSPEVFA
jgi:hypothetical protein